MPIFIILGRTARRPVERQLLPKLNGNNFTNIFFYFVFSQIYFTSYIDKDECENLYPQL